MILFIDDDIRYIKSYIEELRYCGYEVVHQNSVDKAIDFVLDRMEDIDLLLLDIMMPPGKLFENQDTFYGLRTGLLFLKEIKKMSLNHVFPIMIFTNVSANNLPNETRGLVLRKEEYSPSDLVKIIQKTLAS
jgi:CheY-like chemotaxis protein